MNDKEPQEPTVLTADDIRALAQADWISFRYYKGQGTVEASLQDRDGRIYSAREQRTYPNTKHGDRARYIYVATTLTAYGYSNRDDDLWVLDNSPGAEMYASVSTPAYHDAWQTIVSLLRAGDTLALHWTADNNTETIREAGLHADHMAVVVHRGGKRMTFALKSSICPDNSARMIKRHGG